jgi:hypothetical protein
VAPPADAEADPDKKTPIEAEEVPVHLFDETGEFRATGPIAEAIELHQYGSGVDSAVKMGRVLDTHTPSQDDTLTGTVEVAADVYRENVVNGDIDPESNRKDLYKLTAKELKEINYETEDDTKETDESDDEQPTHSDYGGTNVWLIELPQFGDEKRDLDDFLQNGWLALTPPADWALRLSMGDGPATGDDANSAAPAASEWMRILSDRDVPVAEYPTGMAPDSLSFPTANDLTQTVGAIPGAAQGDAFPTYDPHIIPSDPDADSDDVSASHRWPQGDATELRKDGNQLQPVPEANNTYPPLSLFGVIPTIHPTQHPAATGSVGKLVSNSGSEMDVDPQEIEERVEADDYRQLTGAHNPIWSLDLRDLGFTPGSRGKNPFGHFGESENYFVVIDDGTAYCHKRDALYTFQHFALCEMGERDPKNSASGRTLDDYEYFQLWKYCRENNLVPDHTPIPLKGLVGYALKHDFCEPEDLEQFSDNSSENNNGENDDEEDDEKAGKRNLKLPDDQYFPVLKDIEDRTGYAPARLNDNGRSEERQTGHGQEGNSPDVDIEEIALEKAYDQYGGYADVDGAPTPLNQFLNMYTEVESGEVTDDTDQTVFVPKAELRDAYNAWAQINLRYVDKNTDKNAKETGMKTLPPGAFSRPLKEAVSAELEEGRPEYEDGKQRRTWFGIELTEEGAQLAELEGKFDS